MKPDKIRDLLYFDFAKAASIWSQIEGGLQERISVSEELADESSTQVGAGIPRFVEAKFGTLDVEKRSILESKVLHHNLLNDLESSSHRLGLVVDCEKALDRNEFDAA